MISLVCGFAFVVVVLLLILRYAAVPWWLKAGITLASLGAVAAFYVGLVSLLGFPVATRPSGQMRIIASDVHEPSRGDPGVIYLWLEDIDAEKRVGHVLPPRAFTLPYSKDTQRKANQAREAEEAGSGAFASFAAGGEQSDESFDFIAPPSTTPLKGN